jgi:lipopolysaccharide export system protein LptA
VTDSGIARIMGNVHITRGQNQLNGRAAIVNMHTGLATMTEDPGNRVQGLIVPNDSTATGQAAPAAHAPGAKR